uniref:Uncharacterized protein n=1 Tax=viral metagenome TaxID=1070528 RepID=A0A6C0H873_9ZZZZ
MKTTNIYIYNLYFIKFFYLYLYNILLVLRHK